MLESVGGVGETDLIGAHGGAGATGVFFGGGEFEFCGAFVFRVRCQCAAGVKLGREGIALIERPLAEFDIELRPGAVYLFAEFGEVFFDGALARGEHVVLSLDRKEVQDGARVEAEEVEYRP